MLILDGQDFDKKSFTSGSLKEFKDISIILHHYLSMVLEIIISLRSIVTRKTFIEKDGLIYEASKTISSKLMKKNIFPEIDVKSTLIQFCFSCSITK